MTETELTFSLNEQKVLSAMAARPQQAFSFFDEGMVEGSNTWSDVMVDEMATVIGKDTRSARGVFSSLVKKGVFTTGDADPDHEGGSPVYITKLGAGIIDTLQHGEDEVADDELDDVELDAPEESPRKVNVKMTQVSGDANAPASTSTRRFSHENCTHARHGKEGKIARAKCRRERAAAAKAAAEATANA